MNDIKILQNTLNGLNNAIDSGKNTSVFGLSFGEKALFLCNQKRQVVYVCANINNAIMLADEMQSLNKVCKIIMDTGADCFGLNTNTYSQTLVDSIDALYNLCKNKVDCLIISPKVLMQKFTSKEFFKKSILNLKFGDKIDFKQFVCNLTNLGYKKVDFVTNKGEFSIRGDIVNIFNFTDESPIKIDFFDDIIENICYFDVENFKKIRDIKMVNILPTIAIIFDETQKKDIFEKIDNDFNKTLKILDINAQTKLKTLYEEFKINFDAKNYHYVLNWLIPFMQDISVASYFNEDALIVFDDVKLIVDSIKNEYTQFDMSFKTLKDTGSVLNGHKNSFLNYDNIFNLDRQMLSFQQITTQNRIFEPVHVESYKSSAQTNYFGNYDLLFEDLKYYLEFENNIVIFTGSNDLKTYLEKFFTSKNLPIIDYDNFEKKLENNENLLKNHLKNYKKVYISAKNLPYGANFVEDKIVIIGTKELVKKIIQKQVASQNKKEEFTLPKAGDYVVHENFGIALCEGVQKLKFTNYEKDYIILKYDGGDKLYLPTEQIGLISAYVSSGKAPKLNKLGSKDFENTKAKVKNNLKQLAFDLVQLYREREEAKGFKFEIDDKLFEEFENAFMYDETIDQQNAIKDVLQDMKQGKIMDRIVCGDVGYGKTEVALRSAFVCALNGKQTCFLAPTTILSEQHFNNAKARFQNFGITVECLNRFKTKAEQKAILEKLKKGEIDVLCGTHRLLSKDVLFKDLGLLILDEEQRFGVGDKEKIKRLKTNVDVLTLSATPIPRTLHMGLVGIRDISVISTPPKDRLPVQTTVAEYSDALLLNAINRELSRDGQVLIIYNRVETIYEFSKHIKDLVGSEVSIGVAHGQMESSLLEKQILDLYNGNTKILISTTLIENGIDLPSANTLIIVDADKLGLSQLYQLKGRVGRSKNLGYAYFTFNKDKSLTQDAYKRLNAIMEFTELGSGFKIAMKDLEIRGCGNILGAEQSGHMAKVGYDMYCKILAEAVSEIKGQKNKEYKDIKLDVATNCYIPENYIDGSESRFRIYNNLKLINSTKSKETLLNEIESLYGKVPEEVVNLAYVAMLRNLAIEFDVKRISIDRERCLAEFYDREKMLDKNISKSLKDLGVTKQLL